MTLTDIGAYANLLAAAGVIGSLLFVAYQIRQNNKLLRAQTRQTMVERAQSELLAQVADPEIRRLYDKPGPLTEPEKIRLHFWIIACLRQREYEWFQFRSGLLDRDVYQAYGKVILFALGTERNRLWWREMGDFTGLSPEFKAVVDELLARNPVTDQHSRLARLEL
jgi:hypothetical protein